eukprot:GFUD01046383.1.p1 GENE.GFUD01046383.1~~GFUD01046383.1.p1  ORF type:complete len:332 (-),score=68.66 GFUD01046383.1:73-1068(-)
MYSWGTMWSGECDQAALLEFDERGDCFTHPWDSASKRAKLWCICNRAGREIGTLLLYGIAQQTKAALTAGGEGCGMDDIVYLRETIREGHTTVKGLQIFALLSEGGDDVPEKDLVPSLVWYNTNCAQDMSEKLDGVAVNNENFHKSGSQAEKVAYLSNLAMIATNAGNELKTHYSIGWHWFEGGDVSFNGAVKNVVQHMIDIFDSTDMQTAYVLGQEMVNRLQKGFNGSAAFPAVPDGPNAWSYSQALGKKMFATLYLSKIKRLGDCSTTFFPRAECSTSISPWSVAYQSEEKMWEQVDSAKSLLEGFSPSLHYYRGVYSSGGHSDWPEFC